MDQDLARGVSRSSTTTHGVQSVVTTSTHGMRKLFVECWDSLIGTCSRLQSGLRPIMAKVPIQYGWMTCTVVVPRRVCSTARPEAGV
ncbi:hypothetical protein DPMN_052352 [Dreissena polymorpha]|uniref:Uncharacterized protein n=1 Tax=Dreissena polymorpha TaxID=45954 RepID=A0A9D4CLL2_DREPO|nr:hypothetical protein DPMN_052352 [Dreissena polymorpha]